MQVLLDPTQIAENIIVRCKQRNIGVKEFCKELGLGINTVYHYKNGHYPRVDTLYKIASGLGCSMEELCTVNIEEQEEGEEA